MIRPATIPALFIVFFTVACAPTRAEVAAEALTALEREGAVGLLPFLTRDGRWFVESLDLPVFVPEAPGEEILCREEEGPSGAGWRWVTCVQGERTLRLAMVDTGRGPRIDPFRWTFDPLSEISGETTSEGLP